MRWMMRKLWAQRQELSDESDPPEFHFRFSLRDQLRAAAPPMISLSSVVMAVWRARLN